MILTIIGFAVIVGLALWMTVITGASWLGASLFTGSGAIALVPAVITALLWWLAYYVSPFTITFTV